MKQGKGERGDSKRKEGGGKVKIRTKKGMEGTGVRENTKGKEGTEAK